MEHQLVELTIISAENLKDVRHLARLQAFAKAWVDPNVKYVTALDELNGVNPVWNDKFAILIPAMPPPSASSRASLTIEIYTNSFTGVKLAGRVLIPLLHILQPHTHASARKHGDTFYTNYPVETPSGQIHGKLHISYCLKERIMVAQEKTQTQQTNPYISNQAILKANNSENCIIRNCAFLKPALSSMGVVPSPSSASVVDYRNMKPQPQPMAPPAYH